MGVWTTPRLTALISIPAPAQLEVTAARRSYRVKARLDA